MKTDCYTLVNKEKIHFDATHNTWTLSTTDGITIKESRVGCHLAGGEKIFGKFVQYKKQFFTESENGDVDWYFSLCKCDLDIL